MDDIKIIAEAIQDNFTSPNESDRNMEAANVVDGLFAIARAIALLAETLGRSRKLPCIKCGQLFILPFAEGNEKGVICEDCNRE